MANVPTFTTYTTRRRCAAHGAQVRGRQASAGATENIKGAIVITQQKFIAELRMLRTRAKEVDLPIAANMIGRAIEVCESERDGDFLTLRRIEELEVGTRSTGRVAQHRERGHWPLDVLASVVKSQLH
jgi:hypothetical protein